jgi:hypothetical protein
MSSIYGAMMILGLCPILAGIGLSIYALGGSAPTGRSRAVYEDRTNYLIAGMVSIVIGVIIIIVIFALMPVFGGVAETIV